MIGARGGGIRLVLFGVGAVLLVILVARNDPAAIVASISQLSWWLLLVVSVPFTLVNALDTLGWRFAFHRSRVPFRALFSARLAGEAINLTTPTASMGGEPVKAWLLRRHVRLEESVPSIVIAKTTITIGQALLLLVGIGLAWLSLDTGGTLLRAMLWLLAVEVLAVGLFVLAQVSGVALGIGRLLRRLGLLRGREERKAVATLDRSLLNFYREEPRRLLLSIAFHFGGWLAGALETWVILQLLGVDVSLVTATVIESFSTAVRFATFMVPASIGALEGGQMATFVALGLGATAGLSFSIVRRLREITWIAAGLVALAVMRAGPPPPP